MDDPNDDDLSGPPAVPGGDETYTGRLKNVVLSAHLIWRPGGGLLLGTEFHRLETTYAGGTLAVNHINAYAGVAF
jgi:hypothetical protein